MAQSDLVARMIGAATLDIQTYEEVEADSTATPQVGWLIWAGVTYLIGDKILGGTATWGELLRTLGFAQSPGVLYLLAILPLVGGLVRLILPFWMLAAGIVAIRQALDFGTGKAVLTAILGWLAILIPSLMFGGILAFGG